MSDIFDKILSGESYTAQEVQSDLGQEFINMLFSPIVDWCKDNWIAIVLVVVCLIWLAICSYKNKWR